MWTACRDPLSVTLSSTKVVPLRVRGGTIDPQNDYDLRSSSRISSGHRQRLHQYVQLLAWGQDAFHGSPGGISTLDCNALWTAQKPHVIYGVVGVAPGCNLTIEAGADVHVHAGGGLYVSGGTLDVNGELGNPVVFEGDRLEPEYADVPGQWGIQVDTLIQTEIGVAQASILGGGIWIYGSPGSTPDTPSCGTAQRPHR